MSRRSRAAAAPDVCATSTYALDDTLTQVAYLNAVPATPTVTFSYDASYGRLATMVDGTGTTTYAYKAVGALGATGSGNQSTNTYQIDQSGAGATLTYDANGNLTSDGTRSFTWDAENRLLSVAIGAKTSEFTYDGQSRRVRIVEKDSGATTSDKRFVWCELALCEERDATGASVTKRLFGLGVQDGGSSYFYALDHLARIIHE